jgi:hypothetical protein
MENNLIAYHYNSDKSQLYLNNYERYFRALTERNVRLLELGIHKGGSLLMWKDYFRAGTIVGLDLEHVDISDTTGRVRIYQGDQSDLNLLDRMGQECAPEGFDIIIDDASHIGKLTSISFWHLFRKWLQPGGIYVIEDWRCGYWDGWYDGRKYKFRNTQNGLASRLFQKLTRKESQFTSHNYGMVGFIKQLVDELGMDAITNPKRGGTSPQRFPIIQRMEILQGQVFIIKATKEDKNLLVQQWVGKTTVQSES